MDQATAHKLMEKLGFEFTPRPTDKPGELDKGQEAQFSALIDLIANATNDWAQEPEAVERADLHGVHALQEWVEEWLVG